MVSPDYADHGLTGVHASHPNLNFGPSESDPRPLTESDSDHRLAVVEPPSRPPSPTNFDADQENQMVHLPASPGSETLTTFDPVYAYEDMPDRLSMRADSPLESLQAVSDVLDARNALNAAQRMLQRERSLDPVA